MHDSLCLKFLPPFHGDFDVFYPPFYPKTLKNLGANIRLFLKKKSVEVLNFINLY